MVFKCLFKEGGRREGEGMIQRHVHYMVSVNPKKERGAREGEEWEGRGLCVLFAKPNFIQAKVKSC